MANIFGRLGNWAGRQLFGSGPPNTYGGRLDAAGDVASQYGARANDAFLDRATNFDAMDTLRTAAGGIYDQFERDLGQKLQSVRGRDVGAGRLQTGYGTLDENSAVYDARRNLNSTLASLALEAERNQLANQSQLSQFGETEQGNALDMLAGQRDAETSRWNARQQQRGQFYGAVGSLAGKALEMTPWGRAARGVAGAVK